MGKSNRARRTGATVDVTDLLPRPKQWIGFTILGLLIRWRAEIAATAMVLAVFVWVDSFGNPVVTPVVMVGVPVLVLAVPHTRRFVIARVWCVLDRHRLRACLKRTKVRTMTRDGSYPLLLWARPSKTGERIWVWLPAGMAASDIEHSLEYLAPACFARSARLHRPKKVTTFVAVDIIRRDPLESKQPVSSPLSRWRKPQDTEDEGVTPISAAPSACDTSTAESADSESSTSTSATSSTKTTQKQPANAGSVVVNGEDLSDYVD